MKLKMALALLTMTLLVSGARVLAQDSNDAAQNLDRLRAQLSEVQDKEAELKHRVEQLDFDLKPENIERATSGYGSVHPEDLREQRRRQLQSEKDRVLAQLDQLASRRSRLETEVVNAQARAYQQSAMGKAVLRPDPDRHARFLTAGRILIGIGVLFVVGGGIVLTVTRLRRRRVSP